MRGIPRFALAAGKVGGRQPQPGTWTQKPLPPPPPQLIWRHSASQRRIYVWTVLCCTIAVPTERVLWLLLQEKAAKLQQAGIGDLKWVFLLTPKQSLPFRRSERRVSKEMQYNGLSGRLEDQVLRRECCPSDFSRVFFLWPHHLLSSILISAILKWDFNNTQCPKIAIEHSPLYQTLLNRRRKLKLQVMFFKY